MRGSEESPRNRKLICQTRMERGRCMQWISAFLRPLWWTVSHRKARQWRKTFMTIPSGCLDWSVHRRKVHTRWTMIWLSELALAGRVCQRNEDPFDTAWLVRVMIWWSVGGMVAYLLSRGYVMHAEWNTIHISYLVIWIHLKTLV